MSGIADFFRGKRVPQTIATATPIKPNMAPIDNSGPIVAAPHTLAEYEAKYRAAKVRPEHLDALKVLCGRMMTAQPRYAEVAQATGLPWWGVACLHEREASMNWGTYLQNGDPLFSANGVPLKTVHVPKGIGPFSPQTWMSAAIHALGGDGAHKGVNWTPGMFIMFAEQFNGLGYRKRGVPSPYCWSMTDQYVSGKYVLDGVYSPSHMDTQPGVAAMLKVLGV